MTAPAKQTTVVSTKGQVILPKAVRESLNWPPGTKLVVEKTDRGVLLSSEPLFKPTTLDEVIGILKYHGPAFTIEEMDEALLQAVAEDDARIMDDYRSARDRD